MRAVFAILALLIVSLVSAHVSIQPPTVAGNRNVVIAARVPHAFRGHNTTNVTVLIPVGVLSVKPQQVGGWQVKIVSKTNTTTNTSVVESVSWFGGSLPDELFQDFGLQVRLADLANGTIVYFPVVQESTNGTLPWTSIPDASGKLANASYPAAKLTIVNPATPAPSTTSTSSNQATPPSATKSSSSHTVGSSLFVAVVLALTVRA